ncbi:MAG: CsgG/HfaB family protein [bacterium]
MKRYASLGLLLMTVFLFPACPKDKEPVEKQPEQVMEGPKKRVGIFEFENKSRYGKNRLSNAAVDVLYTELQQADVFVLYERADLDELEKEYDLIDSGRVNLDTAARAGKLVGVQAVVVGTISEFGIWEEAKDYGVYQKKMVIAETTVDVRVVNVTTGKVIFADSGTGRVEQELKTVLGFGEKSTFNETMADKALRSAMQKFTGNLVDTVMQIPWQGFVMDVDQRDGTEVIYVNAGRVSGMAMGQELRVKSVTGKLTDPQTGEFKGYKTEPLGKARVIDLTGEDVAVARMMEGSGAKRGDMVMIASGK